MVLHSEKPGKRVKSEPAQVPASEFRGTFPYPHLIIIGAAKCGTSWLRRALDEHPDIRMVPDQIEYFSTFLQLPVEWYLHHFLPLVASSDVQANPPVLGEHSARYCAISPDRIRLIRRLLPEVRLILMTRDPVARHWAHAKRHFQKKRHDKSGQGVLGVSRDELMKFLLRKRRLGQFSQMIENWTDVFPSRQLLIVSQEKTLADPRDSFDAVLNHIGVSRDYDAGMMSILNEQKNRGPSVPIPADIADVLEEMFGSEREQLRKLFGQRAYVYP